MTTAKMSASAAATQRTQQEFCVRWNSHLGSIGAAFPQLLAGQRFVDVTLACEGSQVHCHRLVLAACSSYFESILAENPCKHPVIILPSEVKLWEIQALVDFMYKGEVNVTQAGLPQLLRCAEQLRIRGLYGSDAALNLNQLKAMTTKATAAALDLAESADDTATNSTTTTTTATATTTTSSNNNNANTNSAATNMLLQQQQAQAAAIAHEQQQQFPVKQEPRQQHQQQAQHAAAIAHEQQVQFAVKKEARQQQHQQQQSRQTNGAAANAALLQQQNHQLQLLQLQQQQKRLKQLQQVQADTNAAAAANELLMRNSTAAPGPHSNASTEDDSADDSTSNNAYDQYEPTAHGGLHSSASSHQMFDSTIEDDHNYVGVGIAAASSANATLDASDEDDGDNSINEHDSSANSAMLMASASSLADQSASFKRVRRSEASLAQAAKCVSKGQTFQTVSNMFNIPVSTIRFYMARKGILPKRKRGRGASTTGGGVGGIVAGGVISQALAQLKMEPPFHMSDAAGATGVSSGGYKLNEAGLI